MKKEDLIYDWVVRNLSQAGAKSDLPIPSSRLIAERFGVNKITAEKALHRLVAEGLLRPVRGQGHFPVPAVERRGGIDCLMSTAPEGGFHQNLLAGVADAASQCDRSLRIFSSLRSREEADFLRTLRMVAAPQSVGALVLYHGGDRIMIQLREQKMPVVSVDADALNLGVDSVMLDPVGDVDGLAELLIAEGARSIILLDPQDDRWASPDPDHDLRARTFRSCIARHGLDPGRCPVVSRHAAGRGQAHVLADILGVFQPDAIIAVDEHLLASCAHLIFSLPRLPRLATITLGPEPLFPQVDLAARYNLQQLGRVAVDLLLKRVEAGPGRAELVRLQPQFLRASDAPPPAQENAGAPAAPR